MPAARALIRDLGRAAMAWLDDYAPSMGAALAFYTLFSITPLLLIVISLAGLVFAAPTARAAILEQFRALGGPDIARLLDAMLSSLDRPEAGWLGVTLGLLSLLSLLVGATTVFGELQNAMDRIWHIDRQGRGGLWTLLRSRLRALGLVLSLGFLLIVSLLASAGLAALREFWGPWTGQWLPLAQGLDFMLSWALVSVMFGMIYKWVPQLALRWREVMGGAALAALAFALGKSLMALYIARSGLASPFGAAGSLVVLLLWVDYAALIFLYGAEFTRARYLRRHGHPDPTPSGLPPPQAPDGRV